MDCDIEHIIRNYQRYQCLKRLSDSVSSASQIGHLRRLRVSDRFRSKTKCDCRSLRRCLVHSSRHTRMLRRALWELYLPRRLQVEAPGRACRLRRGSMHSRRYSQVLRRVVQLSRDFRVQGQNGGRSPGCGERFALRVDGQARSGCRQHSRRDVQGAAAATRSTALGTQRGRPQLVLGACVDDGVRCDGAKRGRARFACSHSRRMR
mmetsp:Transcript_100832/g.284403  ORF Transcript_100832/g.284403 Transcript_100832/m.284403 type:complete len:206 (+) Transcript_100832:425-1042(+)